MPSTQTWAGASVRRCKVKATATGRGQEQEGRVEVAHSVRDRNAQSQKILNHEALHPLSW
eukprot:scaffold1093_cov190-Pinguiococcus_pyrenoidosus.AAC.3